MLSSRHTAWFPLTGAVSKAIVLAMRSRVSSLIAFCALAVCLSCQAAEVFDQWDHTIQTGSDTEYTFVVLALCVGVSYSLGWFAPQLDAPTVAISVVPSPTFDSFFACWIRRVPAPLLPGSPPPLSLRI
jgi:hypothetical protein